MADADATSVEDGWKVALGDAAAQPARIRPVMAQVAGARQLLRVVNLSSPPLCYPILLSENGSLTLLPLARMSWESFIG